MMTVQQYFLLKLAEECAEVSQQALKQAQFGKDHSHPKIEVVNAVKLRQEVNDLLAVLDCLMDIGELPEIAPYTLIQEKGKKKVKLLKYLNESRELGHVEGPEYVAIPKFLTKPEKTHKDGSLCCGLGCCHPECDSGPGWA